MKKRIRKKPFIISLTILAWLLVSIAYSHCQIPCGIYDDQARFDIIAEHITTIEKSMNEIRKLSEQDKPNMNQIIRWVQNKEEHADELGYIVTYYFMTQRVKPIPNTQVREYDEYVEKLTLLHKMLVFSMKSKQTTDISNVEELRSLLDKFHSVYFDKT
ncbi:superoxide dismutase [Ni] [Planctomycetota bacterium]